MCSLILPAIYIYIYHECNNYLPTYIRTTTQSLKKQMTKLAVHSVGSRVVELLFATFPNKSIAPLKLELYGPQYALFAATIIPNKDEDGDVQEDGDDVDNNQKKNKKKKRNDSHNNTPVLPSLSSFIADNPDKLESTLSHLQSLLQKGLDKSLTGFAYFHSLLLDYTSIASPNDIRSFLTPALSEHTLHLLSTRAGTSVVCQCVSYGTVKDRKKMIKCLKGYTRSSLLHRDAYLAILRMCDVLDDTVLVNKMLLAELHNKNLSPDSEKKKDGDGGEDGDEEEDEEPSPILDLVLSDTGSKLFLLLLVSKDEEQESDDVNNKGNDEGEKAKASARWQKYFDPYELSVLHRNPTITENGEENVPTSKKEDETRRQELVVYMKELLLEVCTKHGKEMLRSLSGSRVLIEVCDAYPSEEVYEAIVEACAESMEEGNKNNDKQQLSILEDPVGHRTLKQIFLCESKKEFDDDEPSLAKLFYTKFQNDLGDIATSNRGAFVLSTLIENSSVHDNVKNALMSHVKNLKKLANGGSGKDKKRKLAGCDVLLEKLK